MVTEAGLQLPARDCGRTPPAIPELFSSPMLGGSNSWR